VAADRRLIAAEPLQGHEFVAHVFVAVAGPEAAADYRYLADLWSRCFATFGMDGLVDPYPGELPAVAPTVDEGEAVVAVRSRRAGGLHQVVVRRLRDVLCLSLLQAPVPGLGWSALDAEWQSVLEAPTRGVLGSVRIMQARLPAPDAVLDVAALGPVVEAQGGGRWCRGVLRAEPPLGPFAVWEAVDAALEQSARDGRAERRVVVVAPADRDLQLSAWTWSCGDSALTPFARYLLHAAKVRYELRVRAANQGTALRRSTAAAIAQLEPLIGSGRSVGAGEATAATARLAALRAAEVRLTHLTTWLRELRVTVQIAADNMAAHTRGDQAGGLFAEDKDVAGWLDRQLGRDLVYLDGPLERARSVIAAVAPLMAARPVAVPRTVSGLSGHQKGLLISALVQAYPTYDDVAMLLELRLERRLADIADQDRMPTVLWKLIGHAERYGWTRDLIEAATALNPGNPALQELIACGLLDT